MRSKELGGEGSRSFVVVFATGEDVIEGLLAFARDRELRSGHFTAIGAFQEATVAYWNWDSRSYEEIPIDEQVEVLVMAGNIAQGEEGETKVHAHTVLGRRDGSTRGGHLLRARSRPTLEVVLTESPAGMQRRLDEETRLPLLMP